MFDKLEGKYVDSGTVSPTVYLIYVEHIAVF